MHSLRLWGKTMDASSDLLFQWSVIVSLWSLVATLLLGVILTYLLCKRLLLGLSKANQTLQLCALVLHRIVGDSSTAEYLEREVNR